MKRDKTKALKKEKKKLERMVKKALDNGRHIINDKEILEQSQKVDMLLNKTKPKYSGSRQPDSWQDNGIVQVEIPGTDYFTWGMDPTYWDNAPGRTFE